jgi:hypothetical protein
MLCSSCGNTEIILDSYKTCCRTNKTTRNSSGKIVRLGNFELKTALGIETPPGLRRRRLRRSIGELEMAIFLIEHP